MTHTCELKEMPAQPTLVVRTVTTAQELPQTLGASYQAVAEYLSGLGEAPTGPPYTAYFNMDMEHLEIEAGFPVARAIPGAGRVQASELPAGRYGVCLYTGPYPELAPAYEALNNLLQESGCEPTGVAYELYLNSPQDTDPKALQTQILFPLKP